MRQLRYVLCDVFTDLPLAGNALAVFTDARDLGTETMQALARELNLSETTFITPAESGGTVRVRIFTPRHEVAFAGHPTLGTAAVLGAAIERNALDLETQIGHVRVSLERDGSASTTASFALPVPKPIPSVEADTVREVLRLSTSPHSVGLYDAGLHHLVVVLDAPETLRHLEPDLLRVMRLPCDTVDVCAREGDAVQVRVFAPKHGVSEDPATGSAVGPVLWHLHRQGLCAVEQQVHLRQGDAVDRPSRLVGRLHSSPQGMVVEVSGQVVVVARGEFRLPEVPDAARRRAVLPDA